MSTWGDAALRISRSPSSWFHSRRTCNHATWACTSTRTLCLREATVEWLEGCQKSFRKARACLSVPNNQEMPWQFLYLQNNCYAHQNRRQSADFELYTWHWIGCKAQVLTGMKVPRVVLTYWIVNNIKASPSFGEPEELRDKPWDNRAVAVIPVCLTGRAKTLVKKQIGETVWSVVKQHVVAIEWFVC